MYADYHVHCEYSDDSQTPIADQVNRAIELGLSELCFTDHVDYGIKKDWSEGNIQYRSSDGINYDASQQEPLANVDYPKYFAALHDAKEQFRNQINIKQGLEFGIQTHTIKQYKALYKTWQEELDFVLLSMHQVNDKEFWTQEFQAGKTQQEYNLEYYKEILEVMKRFQNYSVLAHLDLIVRYDKHGRFPFEETEDIIAEILKLAIHDGKGIEINTSSWHYGLTDTQPSREILRLYKDLGGTILTTGSDAHKPEYLADHFTEAHQILRSIGFREFCTFDHMEPVFHPLEG